MAGRALLLILLLTSGCARQFVAGAVDGATAPQSQAQIAALIANPDLQIAVNALGRSLVLGALEGLTDEERNAELNAAAASFVQAIVPVIVTELQTEVSPALQQELQANVQAAMSQVLSGENRVNTSRFVAAVVKATLDTLRPELGDAVTQDLGPALQVAIETNLGPALNKVLVDDIGPGLDDVLTFNVLPPLTIALEQQRVATVRDLHDILDDGQSTLRTVSVAVTAVASILLVLLTAAGYFLIKARRDNDVRERTVMMLARQIHKHRDDPGMARLVHAIKEAGVSSEEGSYLSKLLERNNAIKVQPQAPPPG
jgi:hypothetical protein